jgi:hypothetical protein
VWFLPIIVLVVTPRHPGATNPAYPSRAPQQVTIPPAGVERGAHSRPVGGSSAVTWRSAGLSTIFHCARLQRNGASGSQASHSSGRWVRRIGQSVCLCRHTGGHSGGAAAGSRRGGDHFVPFCTEFLGPCDWLQLDRGSLALCAPARRPRCLSTGSRSPVPCGNPVMPVVWRCGRGVSWRCPCSTSGVFIAVWRSCTWSSCWLVSRLDAGS